MTSPREEYLASLMNTNEMTQTLLNGAAMVQQGGVEGIREIAESDPETILAAVAGLATIIKIQQKEHLDFVEHHFELMDSIGIQ